MSAPLVVLPPVAGPALLGPLLERLEASVEVRVLPHATLGPDASTRDLAADAIARMPPVGHVLGISLGGMVAQWVAIDAPERTARLVLASTAARSLGALADPLHLAGLARCLVQPRDAAMACLADGVLTEPLAPRDRERLRDDAPRRRTALAWAAAAARHDAEDALSRIGTPTLVLTGAEDRLIAPASQARLANGIEDAVHRTIEDAGHDLSVDAPEATAREVLAFVRG
ncbi:MAG TPA: alpha/beta fold hydrolase [Sandaracinaceae bacterium LLY-WYZ-13_1]|nr:alpha/beta fold hydrolase [Sandaracinaceae bacterium LLY-WYZ-13_1]